MLKHSELLNAADRERSDWRAWWLVMSNWAAIIALLVLAGLYPSMLTISLLWVVLPGRQLGLSVLMHEAGHGTLFSTRGLNHWVGQWLCALPTLNDLPSYAAVPDANDRDPRMSTRTVIAPAWQRWLLAPHGVNFHLEHHLLPGVPCYHLPALRARLVEMGWLDRVPVFSGYPEVFAHAVRRG